MTEKLMKRNLEIVCLQHEKLLNEQSENAVFGEWIDVSKSLPVPSFFWGADKQILNEVLVLLDDGLIIMAYLCSADAFIMDDKLMFDSNLYWQDSKTNKELENVIFWMARPAYPKNVPEDFWDKFNDRECQS